MGFDVVLNQVAVLFLIIAVGFYTKKRKIIDEWVNKKLSELLLNITVPFLIIASFQVEFSRDMLLNGGIVLICSFSIHAFSMLLAKFLYKRYPDDIKTVLKYITVFSNCGFMGFPVMEALYGKMGVFYVSIYVAVFNVLIWTYGAMLFKGKGDFKTFRKALVNPGTISVLIGVFLFVFSIKLPFPVLRAVETVGSLTTPLSMIIIGAILADLDVKGIFSGLSVYYGSIVRLIVIPVTTFLAFKAAGFNTIYTDVCILCSAMPAAATTAIFAEMYGGDSKFASRCVGISTLLSVLTIPLVILLVY